MIKLFVPVQVRVDLERELNKCSYVANTMKVEPLGRDQTTGRDIYLAILSSAQSLGNFTLASPHFVAFLAWNAEGEAVEAISSIVEELFAAGASYLCTWGSDCERVHDIADEMDSFPSKLASPDTTVRMTTWHENDTLAEAVRFFLSDTVPDEYYVGLTKSSLALCIGPGAFVSSVRQALEEQLVACNTT